MTEKNSNWSLVDATDRPAAMDNSGFHVAINRLIVTDPHSSYVGIRCDIMRTSDNEPMMSFRACGHNGGVSAVRKAVIDWFAQNATNTFERWTASSEQDTRISAEHASYIGAELQRAALEPDFVQD